MNTARKIPPPSEDNDVAQPRVRNLDEIRPLEIAMGAERDLQRERARIDGLLEASSTLDSDGQPMTVLARDVHRVVAYAHGDDPNDPSGAATAARELLSDLVSSRLIRVRPNDAMLEKIDPYLSELSVACCAALGRYRIEVEKNDVPDAWLAALVSIRVASVRTYLCLPDKPGVHLERPKKGADRHRLIKRRSALELLKRRGLAVEV